MARLFRNLLLGGTLGGLACGYYLLRELPVPSASGPAYQLLPKRPYSEHPNKHFLTREPRTIGIVGGGLAGLTTAKVLSQQGFQVEVLEKGPRIGGVWVENYQDAALQGPFYHYNIPDFPFPKGVSFFPKQSEVLQHFDNYVETFQLKPLISLNSEVATVAQDREGSWTVTLKSGTQRKYDFLVLSTGQFYRPYIPPIPGLASFSGKVLHSFYVRNAKELFAGKRVVVVGGGKSAYDLLTLAAQHSGTVTGIMREIHWTIPASDQIYRREVMNWAICKLSELLNPPPYKPKTWLTWVFRQLGNVYWELLAEEVAKDLPDSLKPTSDIRVRKNRGTDIRDMELIGRVQKGEVAIVQGAIEEVTAEGIRVSNLFIPADILVLSTGFQPTTFGLAGKDEAFWLYQGIIDPKIRNFAVIGYGNVACTVLKVNLQAAWLCDLLRGSVSLPSPATMQAQVQAYEAAMRAAYGQERPYAYAYARSEYSYYDSLLTDMHVQTRRTTTVLEDLIGIPDPLAYKLVLTHRV